MSSFSTAQLCDRHASLEHLQIAEPIFKAYGATRSFFGQISTLKTFEDSDLIEQAVNEFVTHKILVIIVLYFLFHISFVGLNFINNSSIVLQLNLYRIFSRALFLIILG